VKGLESTSALSRQIDIQSSGAGKVATFYRNMTESYDEERTSSSYSNVKDDDNRTTEENLFDNRADLKILTSHYAVEHISAETRKQLFNQIDWLLDPEGWEEGDRFANSESFKVLVKFMLNSHPRQAPSLGLTDDGNLVASWRFGDNRLVLECLPDSHIKWFVSCVFDSAPERASGEVPSLKRLLDVLLPYKKAGWFKGKWVK